jgi:hypothetical protein
MKNINQEVIIIHKIKEIKFSIRVNIIVLVIAQMRNLEKVHMHLLSRM